MAQSKVQKKVHCSEVTLVDVKEISMAALLVVMMDMSQAAFSVGS